MVRNLARGPIVNAEPIRLTLTVGPPRLPVDINVIKAQVDETDEYTDDDALLMQYARVAVEYAEKFTGRAFITRNYSLWLDEWPRTIIRSPATDSDWWDGVRDGAISDIPVGRSALEIPRPPCQQINAVRTYDDSDVATTFGSSNYFLDNTQSPARLVLRNNSVTPDPQRAANGIEVDFTAGYGDHAYQVPDGIRTAIAMFTTFLYNHRGDCPMDVAADKSGATILLHTWKVRRI